MNAERQRAGQVRRQRVLALAVVDTLIYVEDADLWLRAQQLATDAVIAALAKRRSAQRCGEEGSPGGDIPP